MTMLMLILILVIILILILDAPSVTIPARHSKTIKSFYSKKFKYIEMNVK